MASNSYPGLFSQSLLNAGLDVIDSNWESNFKLRPNIIVYHWPNHIFAPTSRKYTLKLLARLWQLKTQGTKIFWVVHNIHPHDAAPVWPVSVRVFLYLLDGFIFLSDASRRDFLAAYPRLSTARHLITRHGRYPDGDRESPARRPLPRAISLLMFGLVREYKNVIGLIQAVQAADDTDIALTVAGACFDDDLRGRVEAAASGSNRILLDLREHVMTEGELNAIIDAHDGVVLPYVKILNSGVALHALGRNKPILAPAVGSLPELQESLGQDWVSLFVPPIDAEAIQRFAEQIRAGGPERIDLSAYDWPEIGTEIAQFITS